MDLSYTSDGKELNKEMIKKIGRRILIFRQVNGLSREELAFKIGVCPQQLFKYEMGQNRITVDRLITIAEVLNLKMINFFLIEDLGKKVGMPFLDDKDCEILEHLTQLRKLSGEELIDRFVKMLISEIKN